MREIMRSSGVAGHGSLWIALAILFSLFSLQAASKEVLLTTQQPFSIDNNTSLIIEDTSSPQGAIWLKLYTRNETIDSAMIRQGEYLKYCGKNITLNKIYSGGDSDLVALNIEDERIPYSRTHGNVSLKNMTNSTNSTEAPSTYSHLVRNINTTNNMNNFIFNSSDMQPIGGNASQRSSAAPGESQSQIYPPSS